VDRDGAAARTNPAPAPHRAGRLSIPEALFYASEIAEGVDAVHEVNVIHRDLKPENVFVTRRNDVKVLDLAPASSPATA